MLVCSVPLAQTNESLTILTLLVRLHVQDLTPTTTSSALRILGALTGNITSSPGAATPEAASAVISGLSNLVASRAMTQSCGSSDDRGPTLQEKIEEVITQLHSAMVSTGPAVS